MRMWMVNPVLLCRNHLLGEHNELHMLKGCLDLSKPIQGFIDGGLIETACLYKRHEAIAAEMVRRGYNHDSPMDNDWYPARGQVDIMKSMCDLYARCDRCRQRIKAYEEIEMRKESLYGSKAVIDHTRC